MSTYLYDEALVNKINSWISSSQIEVYGPNETSRMFEVIADRNEDNPITLPIICISRDRGFNIIHDGTTRRALSYQGVRLQQNDTSAKRLTAIPISIMYQVDVYTRYAKEADILVRNLIFNVINYPALEVTIPDATFTTATDEEHKFNHTARIEFKTQEIQDTSNQKERFIEGNFTKLSFVISIEDAYLWDVREHQNLDIEIRIEEDNNNGVPNYVCQVCGYETAEPYSGDCPICGNRKWKRKEINT